MAEIYSVMPRNFSI